ncbi:protein FAR1-RELATED SEQUENCE [Trifolium repens]|nr:protein FAR1-RELATED SEQUENCE [Trifolium repens]
MDVHVITIGEGSGAMENNGHVELEVNDVGNSGSHAEDVVSEPYLGMVFDSEDSAKTFYSEYARRSGFSSKAGLHGQFNADGTNMFREFVCSREGLKRRMTESCGAMVRIEQKGQNKWVVTKFVKDHNHSTSVSDKVEKLQPQKHFSSVGRTMPETYKGVGLVPTGVMYISIDGHHVSSENSHKIRNFPAIAVGKTSHPVKNPTSTAYTVKKPIQKKTLGRDAPNLLEYFKKVQAENPGFFYAIQLDEDNRMSNVFWADARSRTAYSHFGDAVTLDTTHRANHYNVPYAPFTGINHHGQMILFGCALLFDDSEASFSWLFKTFLAAMNDNHPISITTDQDRSIQTAVSKVFPQARHCINKRYVLREGHEKLGHVCRMHPYFHYELYNCINLTETIEEFDFSWNSIIDKYELRGHNWLRSLYSSRDQWVPAYFRDSFFAVLSPNQGFEPSFLDGFVNRHTTLPMFFRQYELALERWFEKEIESDFETISTTPVLKTPSPMENQVAKLYTQKIFLKFQEELVETFAYTANRVEEDGENSIFRVEKFEDDQKSYTVTLNHSELRANCSCQMFEFSGILCRHVLTVFTVSNVFTIPSHYILKRWTRDAKSGVALDECGGGDSHAHESLTSRYTNLCREAIRYAEDGAVAIETYDAAMGALKDGGKKIAVTKKNIAKVSTTNHRVSGNAGTDKKTHASTSDTSTSPLLWPPNDETTGFNLNDAGAPVQPVADLNLPQTTPTPKRVDVPPPVHRQRVDGPSPVPHQRDDGPRPVPRRRVDGLSPMPRQRDDSPPPVPLQQDDGTTENMVAIPCLKSMTWVMENKTSSPETKVAVINLKLQDYSKFPSPEYEVKFHLSRGTVGPVLQSMAEVSEQLSTTANKVAVINLKLEDAQASGESEVKFQVSRDALGAVLRSMAYIREQLSGVGDVHSEPVSKKQRK